MKVGRLVAALALAAAALPGCGGDEDISPTATATPSATATLARPSATPVPPSRTPTSTQSAEPSATPPATPTATPIETVPTATPTVFAGRCSQGAGCGESLFAILETQEECCELDRSVGGEITFSWCPPEAIDETSGQCSQCLDDPCVGLPTLTPTSSRTSTPTVTPSATPTRTLSSLELRIRDVVVFASGICPPPMHLGPYLTLGCGDLMCGFDCDYFGGHGGGADLQRFASSDAAAAAFDEYRIEAAVTDLHGLPAFFEVYPWNQGPRRGSIHRGAFRAGCWLATASSYDESDLLIGAPPSETLELIYQRATAIDLFSEWDAVP